jgi:hypothetical protein
VLLLREEPPRPDPERRREPISPNWKLWFWVVACIGLFAAAGEVGAPLGFVLLLAGLFSGCKALAVFMGPYGRGLKDWHQ